MTDMKGTILLNYDISVNQVEEEEKTRFLYDLLEQMNVPVQEFWTSENSLSINQKIKLRNLLHVYNIQLVDDHDGHLKVFFENQLIGEWKKCTYKIKKDLQAIDPRKQLYLEMYIDCWSLFEETMNQEQ
jgi:hypothetical protein